MKYERRDLENIKESGEAYEKNDMIL